MIVQFRSLAEFQPSGGRYRLLPFRFARIPGLSNQILLTSEVGEFIFLDNESLIPLAKGRLSASHPQFHDLLAKQFITTGDINDDVRRLGAKLRTKKSFLRHGPALHIFVVTLRCDHSCHYCQVSRQSADRLQFDMSEETALAAIDRLFQAPAPAVTVEFQGGEPLLAFDKIKFIVTEIERRQRESNKQIRFSITTTLQPATDAILEFFRDHDFHVSTSIDGPALLHNRHRAHPTHNAHGLTVAALTRARNILGSESIAALTTLTKAALSQPEAIIDEYVRLGFREIFLRPLSPFGFAVKAADKIGYEMSEFVDFYDRALEYILQLNQQGIALREVYTSVLLTHILTPFPSGYVDLRSPVGAAFGALVYNYNGSVYASDEGRMLAEMGDSTFRLGDVNQPYSSYFTSDAAQLLLASGIVESLPGCSSCAFSPYCGADPISAVAQYGAPIGNVHATAHCVKHMGLFEILFRHLSKQEPQTLKFFAAWASDRI